jgi:hypothetical protein
METIMSTRLIGAALASTFGLAALATASPASADSFGVYVGGPTYVHAPYYHSCRYWSPRLGAWVYTCGHYAYRTYAPRIYTYRYYEPYPYAYSYGYSPYYYSYGPSLGFSFSFGGGHHHHRY